MTKLKHSNTHVKTPLFQWFNACLIASICFSTSIEAQAKEKSTSNSSIRYVTDSLEVPLRRGPSYKFKIEKMLRSGTPVQVLEASPNGWMRVRYQTKNKTFEGWMPTVLLQNQPISKIKLTEAIKKNNALETQNNQLKQELQALKVRFEETDKTLKTVQQENFKLKKDYQTLKDASKNALALKEENKSLKQTLKQSQNQLTLYKEQLNEAEDTVQRQWFLTGAGVLFLGIILGRLFRLPQKRKKWDSL